MRKTHNRTMLKSSLCSAVLVWAGIVWRVLVAMFSSLK
jgi:hypothetical protein